MERQIAVLVKDAIASPRAYGPKGGCGVASRTDVPRNMVARRAKTT